MDWSEKARRAFQVVSDAIHELNHILSDKEKIKNDKATRGQFEREVEKIGEAIKRIDKKDPLLKLFKDLRNEIAHEFDVDINKVISTVSDNLNSLKDFANDFIQKNFSSNPTIKSFEKFGNVGEKKDRSKLIDALLDKLTEKDKTLRTSFPTEPSIQKYSSAVDEITNHPDLLKLAGDNSAVASQITEDIANWAKNTQKQIEIQNPFWDEEELLKKTKALSIPDFYQSYEETVKNLKDIYQNKEIKFSFFDEKMKGLDSRFDVEKKIEEDLKSITKGKVDLQKGIEHFLASPDFKKFQNDIPFNQSNYKEYIEKKSRKVFNEADVLQKNFLKDWETQLLKKKQAYELEQIKKAREELIKELYKKINNFNTLRELLEPFTKDLGRLWDLSGGVWQNSGFEILKHFASVLENDKSIKELAEMLGRYRKAEKEFEEVEIEKVIVKPKYKPRHASKGEVIGIRESDDISSMLPVEIATLANPATKAIFLKKYAEKKLMTYDFKNQFASTENIIQKEKQLKEKEESKGPIIICVDTSGSMQGTPEQIAKTVCFALTKIAISENRKCFLISFSTKIQTLELTDIKSSLEPLVRFLNMSFNGGTDASPALEEALRKLNSENFKKADVLMISDFIMSELSNELMNKIIEAKKNKTKFHSLVIGDNQNPEVIKEFDSNWIYDPRNKNSITALVKNIGEANI
jgi:uncharacterized protein with von Willebrand factor type A (vWA) domain/uncharacterized protein with HEPN domain